MPVVKLARKKGHIIYKLKDGTRIPGASTIAKIGEDATYLLSWANDLGRQGLDHNKVREEAADAGSVCHFLIECYLRKQTPDLSEFSPTCVESARRGYEKFLEWWIGEDLTLVESEKSFVSEQHGYGGTLDIIAKDDKDRVWLADMKTSKRIYTPHLSQLAGYEQLWNEHNPEQKIDKCYIIRVDRTESEDFEARPVYDTPKYFRYFLAQLSLYNIKKLL